MDVWTTIINTVIGIVLGAAVALLIAKYRKVKDSEYGEYFKILVGALADAAEYWFVGPGRGREKFEWVMKALADEAAKKGIYFDSVAVAALIEKYVVEVINAGKDRTVCG